MNWTKVLCKLGIHTDFYLGAFEDEDGVTYVECVCGEMVRLNCAKL